MTPWDTSCVDWEERLLSGRSLVPDLPLFQESADQGLRIFKNLNIPDIAGTPTMAEACGPWMFPIVSALFGSLNPETQERAIQEYFLLVPKGNSKTGYFAAVFLTAVILNKRPEGEFHFIAPTMAIANYAFKQASDTIKMDSDLSSIFQIQAHKKLIEHRLIGTQMQVKAADTDVITGGKQVATFIDETHVLGSKAAAPGIFVEIRGALGKRPDGFLLQATTQSKVEPSGQFAEELKTARLVRDGKVKQNTLSVLYELPERLSKNSGWRNEELWPLVNPNMGRSVRAAFIRGEIEKADRAGPGQLALIASQHLNVQIGISLKVDGWEGAEFWPACAEIDVTLEWIIANCEVVTIGIDGGGLDDLLGLAVMGRHPVTRKWYHWAHAWCHPKVLKLREDIAPKLLDLENIGQLTIIKNVGDDVFDVVEIILRCEDAGLLPEKGAIGVDPVGITDIIDGLSNADFDVTPEAGRVVGIPQGWTLSNIIKTLARQVAKKDLAHGGLDLMTWCIGNAKIEPRGNAVTITKQVSGTAKIDPFMATLNSASLMTRNPQAAAAVDIVIL